jgi:hypothetical protein
MNDCRRFAARLRDAIVTSSLVACSPPGGTATTIGHQDPSVPADARVKRALPPQQPPGEPVTGADGLPVPAPPFAEPDNCSGGEWCGHPAVGHARVTRDHRDPAAQRLGCAVEFSGGGLDFYLDDASTQDHRDAGATGACCYYWEAFCGAGRPLVAATERGDARALVAAVVRGPRAAAPDELDRVLGEAWLATAQAEHASIASFSRAAVELMAVGAPLELVAGCHRAGLDEVAHARGCLDLARRYLRRDLAFGPLPSAAPRAADLVTVAVTTFAEGCVGESVAVVVATRAAARRFASRRPPAKISYEPVTCAV